MKNLTKDQKLVLVGACLYQLGLGGTFMSCWSTLVAALMTAFNMTLSRVSMFTVMGSIAGFIGGATLGTVYFKSKHKKNLFWVVIGLILTSFLMVAWGAGTWLWYAAPLVMNFGSVIWGIALPHLLNLWFPDNSATAYGISASCTGIGGMVLNPFVSRWIGSIGLTKSIYALVFISAAIVLPSMFLMFRKPMEEAPGSIAIAQAMAEAEAAQAAVLAAPADTVPEAQANRAEADKAAAESAAPEAKKPFAVTNFALMTLLMLGCNFSGQIPGYQTIFVQSVGHPLTLGASLASLMMGLSIVYKLGFGVICDKIGVFKALTGGFVAVFIATLLYIFFPQSVPMLYLAVIMYTLIQAMSIMVLPRGSVAAYGEEYTRYQPLHYSVSSACGIGVSLLVGQIYDRTGSFMLLFWIIAIFCVINCITSAVLAFRTDKKKK